MEKHSYNVSLEWVEGRKGTISSPELKTSIDVATPPEFDKGLAGIWSPEHLYTAAINSCFMTTFLAIADFSKLEFTDLKCSAEGILEKVEGKYQMTEVILSPILTIVQEKDKDKAERIMHKAEAACLISNSIKTKVILNPKLTF
jgi:peroxiredoxin-like protein